MSDTAPSQRRRPSIQVEDAVEWVGFLLVIASFVGLVVAAALVSTALAVGVASLLGGFLGVTMVVLANRYVPTSGGDRS